MGEEGTTSELLYCVLRFLFLDNISYNSVELYAHFNFAIRFYFVLEDISHETYFSARANSASKE